jgi:hypothetical protein
MGTEKYISEAKIINFPVEKVYDRLSNLRNIEKLFNPEKLKEVKDQIPNAPDIKFDNFQATEDECSFNIKPIGKVGFSIMEREPNKLVKLKGNEGLPFDFKCWLQLLTVSEGSCKIRLTLHAELNPMIKMMVNKHLEEGVNNIANALTKIDFA